MKKLNWIFTIVIIFTSCIKNNELPYNGLLSDPGYFIECYLEPGDIYKLTATELQPLSEDYILDYSLDFDVWIDSIKLTNGLFNERNSNYVYNYGHYYKFNPKDTIEAITLKVLTPSNDTVTGESTIPGDVEIINFKRTNNGISFNFMSSEEYWHNYFMVNINIETADTTKGTTRFLDYSHLSDEDTIAFEHEIFTDKPVNRLEVALYRITEENFNYQISIENAKDANSDNIILPSPLKGNLINAIGIFTCYSRDNIIWNLSMN